MAKKQDKPKQPPGRPSVYTRELAETICSLLTEGITLREVCRQPGMPSESAVRQWVQVDMREDRDDPAEEGFSAQYARAREAGYMAMADEVLEIADDGRNDWLERQDGEPLVNSEAVARSRLRFDARRWLLSKALPKVYGDKMDLSNSGGVPFAVQVQFGPVKPEARPSGKAFYDAVTDGGEGDAPA